jgi:hypothetical protein
MQEYLGFRKMITPTIIQILFWIGVAFAVISALGMVVYGLTGDGQGVFVLFGLIYLVLGPVFVRIWCELLILLFRMNETLGEIKTGLTKK